MEVKRSNIHTRLKTYAWECYSNEINFRERSNYLYVRVELELCFCNRRSLLRVEVSFMTPLY